MPGAPSMPRPARVAGAVPHEHGERPATGRWRRVRGVLTLGASLFAAGGSVGYLLGGVVAAMVGLIAAVIASAAITVMLSAMLGRRDSRSPFIRLILIICVITGRQPGDYLVVPSQGEHPVA